MDLWSLVQSNIRASLHFGSGDQDEIEMLSKASGEVVGELMAFSDGRSKTVAGGKTFGTSDGTVESNSLTRSEGSTRSHSRSVDNEFDTGITNTDMLGESIGTAHSAAEGKTHTRSASESQTSSLTEINQVSRTQYLRRRLRPEDVAAVFNKPLDFIYWVRRGVSPLVDFDGQPIAATAPFALSRHVYNRRDKALWPRPPGKVLLAAEEYVASKKITEAQMVMELIDTLKEPY